MKIRCLNKVCSECGKKIGIFSGYRHPIFGWNKCVCKTCFQKIDESEEKYRNFISQSLIHKNGCWAICFVLINVIPTYEKYVYNQLARLSNIIEMYPLLGKYDIIVKIEATNSQKLNKFVLSRIRTINGIENTQTLTGTFSICG